jgi:hypothetical protein
MFGRECIRKLKIMRAYVIITSNALRVDIGVIRYSLFFDIY